MRETFDEPNAIHQYFTQPNPVKVYKPGVCHASWCILGFLKLPCRFVCVCLPPRPLLTNGILCHDMNPTWLVKQVLQLSYGCYSWYQGWLSRVGQVDHGPPNHLWYLIIKLRFFKSAITKSHIIVKIINGINIISTAHVNKPLHFPSSFKFPTWKNGSRNQFCQHL